MSDTRKREARVIAVDPTPRGFGFVVFEGPDRLLDWGNVQVRGRKHQACVERFAQLCKRYAPEVVIVEDYLGEGSRRCVRVKRLIYGISRWAEGHRLRLRRFSPVVVREAVVGSYRATKEEVASVIVARHPELHPFLPPHRKCWMTEDLRMSLFDAAGLAIALFTKQEQRAERKAA